METPNKNLIIKVKNLLLEAETELTRELNRIGIREHFDEPTTKKLILINNSIYTARRNLDHALEQINKMEVK